MKRKIKLLNEGGSGLVLSLMVLLVLAVLGASLGAITISSLKLGTISRDSNSAYYIAEAGANRAYEELKKEVLQKYENSETADHYFSQIGTSEKSYGADSFEKQFGAQPEAKVKVFPTASFKKGNVEREFTIQSLGEIDGKKRIVEKKVLIKWVSKQVAPEFPKVPPAVLVAKTDISLAHKTVIGDIYLDSDQENIFTIGDGTEGVINGIGKIVVNTQNEAIKDIFVFPGYYVYNDYAKRFTEKVERKDEFIDWDAIQAYQESMRQIGTDTKISAKNAIEELRIKTTQINKSNLKLDVNNGHHPPILITENYKQPQLTIQGHHTIDIGDNDILLAVSEVNKGWGETKIIGGGSLTFFIDKKAALTGGAFNVNKERVNLNIFLDKKVGKMEINGNSTYYAQINAPHSIVEVSGSGAVVGDIIAKKVVVSGAGKVTGNITADEVNVQSSQKITGNIIANQVNLSGSAEIQGDVISELINIPAGTKVNGNLISNKIDFSGAGKVIGNVSADTVTITGGGTQVTGSVVAHSIKLEGGGTIQYKEFEFPNLGGGGSQMEIEISDLVEPGPVLEVDAENSK